MPSPALRPSFMYCIAYVVNAKKKVDARKKEKKQAPPPPSSVTMLPSGPLFQPRAHPPQLNVHTFPTATLHPTQFPPNPHPHWRQQKHKLRYKKASATTHPLLRHAHNSSNCNTAHSCLKIKHKKKQSKKRRATTPLTPKLRQQQSPTKLRKNKHAQAFKKARTRIASSTSLSKHRLTTPP